MSRLSSLQLQSELAEKGESREVGRGGGDGTHNAKQQLKRCLGPKCNSGISCETWNELMSLNETQE